ncbi:MAG: TetR family transcriptional regulator, partial [Planctomycetes bacterium]|nr:TetR family transcriptional regulator [Planctomycetota bacterium]
MQFGRNTLTIPGYVNTFLPSKDVFFWQPVVGIGCSATYCYTERCSLASATTREIAQLAGQNISAIAYYFGNKEGLYFAVAHHIGDILLERLGPLLDEIEAQLGQGSHDPETCLHLFGRLIGASLSTHQE